MERVCRNHNNKIEDAVVSLRAISFADVNARNRSQSSDCTNIANCGDVPSQSSATCKLLVMLLLISYSSYKMFNVRNVSALGLDCFSFFWICINQAVKCRSRELKM